MQSPGDDERQPHPEVVDLQRSQSAHTGSQGIEIKLTSNSLDLVNARTEIPMSFVIVIPEKTCHGKRQHSAQKPSQSVINTLTDGPTSTRAVQALSSRSFPPEG